MSKINGGKVLHSFACAKLSTYFKKLKNPEIQRETRTNLFLLNVFWKWKYQLNSRIVTLRTVDLRGEWVFASR